MDYNYEQTPFSKSVFTGLFAGLATTLCCLVYDFIYRYNTGFTLSAIINVASIIFACNVILVVCGMLYQVFRKTIKGGGVVFIVLFTALSLFLLWKAAGVQRSPIESVSVQFRGLLMGVTAITGASISFLVPYLYHSKKFAEHVI
jgi:hypothetical protein